MAIIEDKFIKKLYKIKKMKNSILSAFKVIKIREII
jgi:hypothetical protein